MSRLHRRKLLQLGLASAAAGLALPACGWAAPLSGAETRRLAFSNLHTGEAVEAVYWEKGNYISDAMQALNKVLRDFRTNEVHPIDPKLYDLLDDLSAKFEAKKPFQVISGYRSPATNSALRAKGGAHTEVATRSLHMDGQAMDIRIEGVELTHLRNAALTMQRGGVGYYPVSNFVHVDTGRVRKWAGA